MKKINLQTGFTLLEALVAISILMVAVVAPITIAQRGLSSAIYSKNQMIASYLAQDAIEYIRNKRDEVTLNNPSTNDWLNLSIFGDYQSGTLCFADNGCQINTLEQAVGQAVENFSASSPLQKDKTNGLYGYNNPNGVDTNFTRKIKLELRPVTGITDNLDEIFITVTVGWGGGNEVVVKTLMYNY
jgi:Tfp pilus assembly protein PilV